MPNGTVDRQTTVERLLDKLADALDKLVTLEIVTVVATTEVRADGNSWSLEPAAGAAKSAAKTTIRLDQGDITNVLSDGALENEKLMKLHSEQVALSRQIVAENLKALMDVARSLAS